jgi:hypothetical protein
MKASRRDFLYLTAAAAALATGSRIAWAQAYPTRPARIVAGFPPGGITDTYARLIAQWLSEHLGQILRREPAGRRRYARSGDGREVGAGWIHTAAHYFSRCVECDALQQSQFQRSPRFHARGDDLARPWRAGG